ncbi:MAG: hypothetical protein GC180_01740 [Bacteroidetes bacterium]|nr:hypothetical protein [Bacteroidota bacterium]
MGIRKLQKKVKGLLLLINLLLTLGAAAQNEVEFRMAYGGLSDPWFYGFRLPIPSSYQLGQPAFSSGIVIQHKPVGLSFRVRYGIDYSYRRLYFHNNSAEGQGINVPAGIEFRTKGKWQFRAGGGLRVGFYWNSLQHQDNQVTFKRIVVSSYLDLMLAYQMNTENTLSFGISAITDWSPYALEGWFNSHGGSNNWPMWYTGNFLTLRWIKALPHL